MNRANRRRLAAALKASGCRCHPKVTPDRVPTADAQETGLVEHGAHCPLGQKMAEAALAGRAPVLVFNAARRCDR